MNWWVIQCNRGVFAAYGPYKTKPAAENRYNKTHGGEINLFETWATEAEEAIADFKMVKYDPSNLVR